MIRLYDSDETDFSHNGIVLDDIVIGPTCIATDGINEIYNFSMEISITGNEKWKQIKTGMRLQIDTEDGDELFTIKGIDPSLEGFVIYGWQVFFDLQYNFIMDTNIVKKDGRAAINQLLGNLLNNELNTYYGDSDISTINSARIVRKSATAAIVGDDSNSFLNKWGGELYVNRFNFKLLKRLGTDRNFQIRYGKNVTGFNGKIDEYSICTRIIPIGFDGLLIPERYVDSQYINNYPKIYANLVKFEHIKVKENEDDEEGYETEAEAIEALRQAAKDWFIETKCDEPSFSGVVNFEYLRTTKEYEHLKHLETVRLGDDVHIYIKKIGIEATSRVVKRKWNFFEKRYVEITIGEISENAFRTIVSIKNKLDEIAEDLGGNSWQDLLDKSMSEAEKMINEGIKDSYTVIRKNEILIMDSTEIDSAKSIIRANKNGIAFGQNGYYGNFGVAITIDGKINADYIAVGTLNAALIKAGVLMSKAGNTWINMDTGEFNFGSDKTNVNFTKDKIKVSNGSFELENANGTVVIDGTSNMFKIFTTIDLSLDSGSSLDYVYTIKHGMGYTPAFQGFQVDSPGATGGNTHLPAFSISGRGDTGMNITSAIRITADETNLYVLQTRYSLAARSDFKVRIFIYKEALI